MKTLAVPVIAVLMLVLSGCATTDAPGSKETSAASASPSASESATASPAATPSPSATTPADAAAEAGCDTVLTDDEYASLLEDHLTLQPDPAAFDDVMQSVMDDGFGCLWRGGGDVAVWYAQAEQPTDSWEQQKQQLVAEGWSETNAPIQGVLQASPDHDPNYTPVVTHRDGVTYYASYAGYLSSVKALQG